MVINSGWIFVARLPAYDEIVEEDQEILVSEVSVIYINIFIKMIGRGGIRSTRRL